MIKRKFWWFIVLVIIQVQCADNDLPCRLTSYVWNDIATQLTYNPEGKVSHVTEYRKLSTGGSNEPTGYTREVAYDDLGRIVQVDDRVDGYLYRRSLLEYSESKIIQYGHENYDHLADWKITYNLDDEGKVIQTVFFGFADYTPITITNNDEFKNGNIVMSTENLTNEKTLEYDNHPNPFMDLVYSVSNIYLFDYWFQNRNNISSVTYSHGLVSKHSYKYGLHQLPTQISSPVTGSFSYDCP